MTQEKKWVRLHTDIQNNYKLLALDPADRWYFILLLTMKGRGMLDKDLEPRKLNRVVAGYFSVSEDETARIKEQFLDMCLIEEDWQPVGWSERQYEDGKGAERSKRYREKQKPVQHEEDEASCPARAETNVIPIPPQETVAATSDGVVKEGRGNTGTPRRTIKNKQDKKTKAKSAWQPEAWVNRELWEKWSAVVGASHWHAAQLDQAQASLRRIVYELGWPQDEVITRAIARSYKSFYPLNAPGQPEKNTSGLERRLAPERNVIQEQIREAQLEVVHWKKQLELKGPAKTTEERTTLLRRAEARLSTLVAKQVNGPMRQSG